MRRAFLQSFGFSAETTGRLLDGLARDLPETCPGPASAPPANELFVPDWIACCLDAHRRGPVAALREVLFELNFPIAGGISGTPEYQSLALPGSRSLADIRNKLTTGEPAWQAGDQIRVFMHNTGAGLLPVIHAANHADFVTLVRAIVHRNEPAPVPASMGSNFINGYTNRSRYLRVREAIALNLMPPDGRDPQLWKDKFLLLASGPYSGVPAEAFGLDQETWIQRSTEIRLHHESCHYLIRRLFPRMKFGLQDELVADFAGLMGATGHFHAADFLRYMGLEDFPRRRPGGRMENYARELCCEPETADAAALLLIQAARHLEQTFASWPPGRYQDLKPWVLAVLTHTPLENLAAPGAPERLETLLTSARTGSLPSLGDMDGLPAPSHGAPTPFQ